MIGMTTGWRQHVYRRGFQFNHGLIRRLKSPVFVTKVMSFHPPFTRLMSNIHFGTNWWPCTPSIQRPLLKFVLQTKTQCLGLFSSNTVLKIVFSASAVATMFIFIVWDPTRLYWCLENVWVLDQNDHDHLCFIMTWKLNPCACWSRVWTFLRFGFWRRHKLMHQVLKTRSCLVRICFHRYLFMLGRSKLWYHHAHGVNFTSVQDNAITLLHSHSKDYCLWWTSKIILWRRRWALRDSVRR